MDKGTLEAIAKKLAGHHAKNELKAGYVFQALHVYDDDKGNVVYIRIRLKHPDGKKWIRPFHLCSKRKAWVLGEPKFNQNKLLYHLNNIVKNPHKDIWVVEGEQKVDRLECLGYLATTSGSSSSASTANWEILRDRNIIIWRDYDASGLSYAREVCSLLRPLNCRIKFIDVAQLHLPEKGDIIDWLEMNPGANQETLHGLPFLDDLPDDAAQQFEWLEPLPLTTAVLQNPYPLDALPSIIRDAVIEVQNYTKAPIALVAASALSAISLACQTYIDIKRDEKLCGPTGLFMVTIADSGERKSTCDNFFTKSIYEYEQKQADAAKPLFKDYNAKMAAWQAKGEGIKTEIRKLAGKGKDTKQLESSLIDLEHVKPEPPKVPRLIYSDVTPEALKSNLAMVWPSAGIISSEGGIVFGAHGMNKDTAMRNLSTYNQGWDGKGVPTDRRTSESFRAQEVRLTMAVQVQEVTIKEFTSRLGSLARGIGYFARVLFSWPESTQGQRFFTEAPEKWPHLAIFNQRITGILNSKPPIEQGVLTPNLMSLAPLAKLAWIKFHDAIEGELSQGGELCDVRDVASKLADNAARLAALFNFFEFGIDEDVSAESFDGASLIALWHLNEARRFFGELALSPVLINADRLESWLIGYCKKNNLRTVPTSIVLQTGPSCVRKASDMRLALHELQVLNRVRLNIDTTPNCIELNPALFKDEG
ncbi:5' DNA primase TraC [Legionella donaldsonii]|uniref:5' DNA primase TraC n=1 Tax=Legionella donaldsonii TaxID=45060 RepID=A0A378JAJ3_9GAMM|nr:YfjI family protein [Legionella donaldsonii]STX44499.1 5' DNA primase TraC [Legionella donaldsonii]